MKYLSRQRGMSLIELMISITLGLILLLAITQVLLSSRQAFVLERENAILQENARFAMDALRREIAVAGSTGCRNDSRIVNLLTDSANPGSPLIANPGVTGYEHEDTATARPPHYPSNYNTDSDSVLIRYADLDSSTEGEILSRTINSLNLQNINVLEDGDIVSLTSPDCGEIIALRLDEVAGSVATIDASNCISDLISVATDPLSAIDCTAGSLPSLPALTDYQIREFRSVSFFVAPSSLDNSVPALWKYETDSGEGGGTAEELIQGVENMQLLYGYDSDATEDHVPNQYLKADAIPDWSRVTSIRVSVLVRSIIETEPSAVSHPDFEGISIANDRFTRRQLSAVVLIKNMGGIK